MTEAHVYIGTNPITTPFLNAFVQGLKIHGVNVVIKPFDTTEIGMAYIHVFWGMKHTHVIKHCVKTGTPFICLDHGYTHDRYQFASINLNNLNAKSELDMSEFSNNNDRCVKHGWYVKPFKTTGDKQIIIGQIYDDRSLEGNDVYAWADKKAKELYELGVNNILFKPHPLEKPVAKDYYKKVRVPTLECSMKQACEMAACFHTFSSTSGSHAWLEGISATAHSPMSMIFKDQFKPATMENRQKWLNEISWRQFCAEEISSGMVWDLIKNKVLGKPPISNPGVPFVYPP